MNRILVFISLSDSGLETIKSNPELPVKEMEYIKQWKQENILESFFIKENKKGAVLVFQNIDETTAKERMQSLPYFPYMASVDYYPLEKQF
ncbi:MAG: hypothetical protein MUF42_15480 [Cytophagaceae bacterium]|jgi:hypothetical protein|nr:hypothetical protein [Cytophagaceae bacterium]